MPNRRYLTALTGVRFRLVTLLTLIALAALILGGRRLVEHDQRVLLEWVERHGGKLSFDWQVEGLSGPPGPVWLRVLLSDAPFQSIETITINVPNGDVEPLRYAHRLRSLELSSARLQEFVVVSSLESLDLACPRLTDVGSIAACMQLNWLRIRGGSFREFALGELEQLEVLSLKGCSTRRIDLKGLTALEMLEVEDTPIRDISSLRNLSSLQFVNLSNTRVSSVEPLAQLPSLVSVDVSGTFVDSIEALGNHPTLQNLYCSGTLLRCLPCMEQMASLKLIAIDDTEIGDLRPLVDVPNLKMLTAEGLHLMTLRPIEQLSSLGWVSLKRTDCSQSELARLRAACPSVQIDR